MLEAPTLKTLTLSILLALMIAIPTIPLAMADEASESRADCENGQGWAGYTQTDSLRVLVGDTIGYGTLRNCEGEHWDGQDSVQPSQDPGTGADCNKAQTSTDPNSLFVGSCMSPDPNSGAAFTTNGEPVAFRVGVTQNGNTRQVYTAEDIALVGRAAVYLGHCEGGAGLEGASSCGSATDGTKQTRAGVYLRDNTPGDLLAQVVSAVGLTKGHVSEADCDQATYQHGAETGDRTLCGRDNTAISIDSILP